MIFLVNAIKTLCTKRGVTIAELESSCGIGKNTIYRWDENTPSVDRVKKVADFFGVTVDKLLAEET